MLLSSDAACLSGSETINLENKTKRKQSISVIGGADHETMAAGLAKSKEQMEIVKVAHFQFFFHQMYILYIYPKNPCFWENSL